MPDSPASYNRGARGRGRFPRRFSRPNWFQRNREWVLPLFAVLITASTSYFTVNLQLISQAQQANLAFLRANKQAAYSALLSDDVALLAAQAKQVDLVVGKTQDPTQIAEVKGEISQLSSKVLLDVQVIRLVGSGDVADQANRIENEHVAYASQYMSAMGGANPQDDVKSFFRGHDDTLTGHKDDGTRGLVQSFSDAAGKDLGVQK